MSNIKDVAKMAGVSVGSVSRYLNGAELKDENKKKIETAILELDYKINPIARGLKTNKSNTIGVIITNFADIYATTILKNIENTLYPNGYNIFACDSAGDEKLAQKKAQLLLDRMIDGLIIYPGHEDLTYLNELNIRNVPVVTIDTQVTGIECDQVVTDNIQAVYEATEWLISQNHRKIAFIGAKRDYFTAIERIKGFERAMEDFRIDFPKEFLIEDDYSEKTGYEAVCKLFNETTKPTAIIASNYYTTIGAMKAFYDLNIKVPDEVSFIGFDNLGLSEIVRPKLTIISQPMELIGKTAAEIILKRIHGDMEGFPEFKRLKAELIIRDSVKRLK